MIFVLKRNICTNFDLIVPVFIFFPLPPEHIHDCKIFFNFLMSKIEHPRNKVNFMLLGQAIETANLNDECVSFKNCNFFVTL